MAATEIVHIGQTVMGFDGTIDYLRDTVFNYPTMAECYKVAALDGLNKLWLLNGCAASCPTAVTATPDVNVEAALAMA